MDGGEQQVATMGDEGGQAAPQELPATQQAAAEQAPLPHAGAQQLAATAEQLTLQQLQANFYGGMPLESPMFLPIMPVRALARLGGGGSGAKTPVQSLVLVDDGLAT